MKVLFASKNLIAVALLVFSARFASASECVVPDFNAQQHTYISPALQQDTQLQERLSGLSNALVSAGSINNHQIVPYFIACQMNYQTGIPGVQFAHDVFEQWKSSGVFPSQNRVVVIAWVRNGLDTNHGSVGAYAGQALQDLGFTGDYFGSESGPVLGNIREYMPDNPQGEFVHIVRQVGDDIDSQIENARQEAANAKQAEADAIARHKFFVAAEPFALAFVVLAFFVVLTVKLWRSFVKTEKARELVRSKDARITMTLSQLDDAFKTLATKGLNSVVYFNAIKSLRKRLDVVRVQAKNDPFTPLDAIARLDTDADTLQKDLTRALSLLTIVLPSVEQYMNTTVEEVAHQRTAAVTYAFPGTTTPAEVPPLFQLTAKGGNPDVEISLALDSIAAAKTALVNGKVDEAKTHFDAAGEQVRNAVAIIDETVAAAAGVESTIATIRNASWVLLQDCEEGHEPLRLLGSEFAPVNFADVATSIEDARKVAASVDSVIEDAGTDYFKQDFLAAKKRLSDLLKKLKDANTRVDGIASRLTELRKKRETVLSNLAKTGETVQAVGSKLQQNSSSASSTAKRGYDTLQQQHNTLSQASQDNGSINWLTMYILWEAFNSGANNVSSQIDSDRSSYEYSQRAAESARESSIAASSISIDISSSGTMGGSGGGNY